MTLLIDAPLASSLTGFSSVQANGQDVSVPIPGRVDFGTAPDGSPALHCRCYDADAQTYGGVRSEIAAAAISNQELWYCWEMYIPSSFPAGNWLVMQIHDTPDGGESPVKWPNFTLEAMSGWLVPFLPNAAPTEAASSRQVRGARIVYDRWVRCCLHTNWGTTSAGFIELLYDDKTVFKEWQRACGYTDAVGPYLKLGVYDIHHNGGFGMLEAWYRNCKVYGSGESYASALGYTPAPANALQSVK